MTSRLEKLLFTVSLIDRVSSPAGKIMGRIDKMVRHTRAGLTNLAAGGAGLISTGYALNRLLGPSVEMQRALGEVKSLDVTDKALKKLQSTALFTAIKYGGSAADIVRSSYDIQSAISGLSGSELSQFTRASAVLARGTKSDAATITDYMGTMYGIFQNTAKRMGKARWVEEMSGQTALAVKMFKTTGTEMAAAYKNLGAEAVSNNVAMHEQMAVLGTLQATMSGSEAATKYKSFLHGIGKAQDDLNLKFTDTQGRMLPIVEILKILKTRFGDIDTVAKSDLIKNAFGRKEAVGLIKLLLQDTEGLASNIDALGKVKGMREAEKMARAIANPWERLAAAGFAVRTGFGNVIQPVLNPVIEKLIKGGETLTRWTELFPNLSRVVGIAILGLMGLIAAISLVTIVGGLAHLVVVGWTGALLIFNGVQRAFQLAMGITTAATWLFNAALLANPITWIILGVVALVGALTYLALNWESVSQVVNEFSHNHLWRLVQAWNILRAAFTDNIFLYIAFLPLKGAIALVSKAIEAFNKIPQWWTSFKAWLGKLNPFDVIGEKIDWLVEKINLIPGVEIGSAGAVSDDVQRELASIRLASPSLDSVGSSVPSGGLSQAFNNRSTVVEKLEVNTTGGVDGWRLADELAMAGG